MREVYPILDAYDCGRLDVGSDHNIYWESHGNSEGKPALVVHGGPGSGLSPWTQGLLDPDRYRIVLYDQRNCGRSTPHASAPDVDLTHNTTDDLVADIERLGDHLGVERWLILGGSWGSTLALAYAESYPERVTQLVLFGVFLGLHHEFDLFCRGGLSDQFTAQWRRLREAVLTRSQPDEEVVEAVHTLLFHPESTVRERAAREWCLWESALLEPPVVDAPATVLHPRLRDPAYALCFARIVTHYARNYAWLKDGLLLDGAAAIADVPTVLINGRDDPQAGGSAEDLARLLPLSRSIWIEDAGHSARHADYTSAIITATDNFANS